MCLCMFVMVLLLSHLLEGVCPSFSLRSLGTQWRCVEVKGSLTLSSGSLTLLKMNVRGRVYLLLMMAVHFAVMVTFSCPLCTRSSKPSTTAQNNRIIECVGFIGGSVAEESMTLTPPAIFGTNEMACALFTPQCVEGYNCFFFCGTPILLNEGVCVPLSSR